MPSFHNIGLLADPVIGCLAVQSEVEVIVGGMRGVGPGPEDGREIAASRDAQPHQEPMSGRGRVRNARNRDALSAGENQSLDVDGISRRMLAHLTRSLPNPASTLEAWTHRQGF